MTTHDLPAATDRTVNAFEDIPINPVPASALGDNAVIFRNRIGRYYARVYVQSIRDYASLHQWAVCIYEMVRPGEPYPTRIWFEVA